MDRQERTNKLRRCGIEARNSLSPQLRENMSLNTVLNIMNSQEFCKAKTVMLYRAIRSELDLDSLTVLAPDKKYVYPLCVSRTEMIALCPEKGAWAKGFFCIEEPIKERSEVVLPEDIDLVLCPCTAFDDAGGRIGMGAGFYDRYLPGCVNAHIAAVAFEVQRVESVHPAPWDKSMDTIFTEKRMLCCSK